MARDKTIQRKHIPFAEVLAVIDEYWAAPWMEGIPWYRSRLVEQYPYKVVLRRVEQLVDMDVLNFGSSIGSPFYYHDWPEGCVPDSHGRIVYGWPY